MSKHDIKGYVTEGQSIKGHGIVVKVYNIYYTILLGSGHGIKRHSI